MESGGGDGTPDGMEARVKTLEDDMKEIRSDLKALRLDTAEIKGKLSGMPSAEALGQLRGRVESLPTTARLAGLLAIAVAIFTLVTKWSDVIAVLR